MVIVEGLRTNLPLFNILLHILLVRHFRLRHLQRFTIFEFLKKMKANLVFLESNEHLLIASDGHLTCHYPTVDV